MTQSTTVPNLQPFLPNPNTPWLVSSRRFSNACNPQAPQDTTTPARSRQATPNGPSSNGTSKLKDPRTAPSKESIASTTPLPQTSSRPPSPISKSKLPTPPSLPNGSKATAFPCANKSSNAGRPQPIPILPSPSPGPAKEPISMNMSKSSPSGTEPKPPSVSPSATSASPSSANKTSSMEEAELGPNTDLGYFGSGIYFTNSARYAAQIYAGDDGRLFLAWVSMREPYPVVADAPYDIKGNPKPKDMQKLEGYGAYQNYNAHYIPVAPIDPSNKMCAVYYPCAQGQEPFLDEIVVFQKSQALARFLIELQIDLPKSTRRSPSHRRCIAPKSPRPPRNRSHPARQGCL